MIHAVSAALTAILVGQSAVATEPARVDAPPVSVSIRCLNKEKILPRKGGLVELELIMTNNTNRDVCINLDELRGLVVLSETGWPVYSGSLFFALKLEAVAKSGQTIRNDQISLISSFLENR